MSGDSVRIERAVLAWAVRSPGHTALVCGDRRWSYERLAAEVRRRAGILIDAGLRTGDIVTVAEPVSDELIVGFLACCHAGLVVLPLSPQLTSGEQSALTRQARPALALVTEGQPREAFGSLRRLPLSLPGEPSLAARCEADHRSGSLDAEGPAVILTTSGSTGARPKLAVVPHRRIACAPVMQRGSPWEGPNGVHATTSPQQFEVVGICRVLIDGATLVVARATAPAQLEAELAAAGVTIMRTVPAKLRQLVEQRQPPPPDLQLRLVRTKSAGLAPEVKEAAERRYGALVLQSYGTTEMGNAIETPPSGAPLGSIGRPIPGMSVRLICEDGRDVPAGATGELIYRGPGTMLGYLDDPEATAAALHDGWFHTGDLARCDAEGFYYLEGRRALQINVGGFKVSPDEVEAVLAQHPGVREAAVTALADPARGEVVRAVLVAAGAAPPSETELIRFCRAHLAPYKVPRCFEFRAELPRSPLGKVLRQQL